MGYTVKQLADIAGVTTRTLHYYDEIGLLRPASYGDNGYRYYDEDAVLRLQQILFFRELDFGLERIKTILDRPDFDLLAALAGHRRALEERVERIYSLIDTIDHTIQHIRGEIPMSKKDFYKGFDEAQQKQRAQEAEKRWGEPAARSQKAWEASDPEEKNAFLAQMSEISGGIAANMEKGYDSPVVQEWVGRWHQFINDKIFACSLEVFENLGHMYVADPEFKATYENIRPGLAAFMEQAMTHYCVVKTMQ